MKLITFTVPCYNSEAYMRKCVDSLLVGGDDVEIIIVNDGSKDKTGEIADEYAKNYPEIVKVIHKENGGHGSGLNAGLKAAKGLYFKVVDSDDWLEEEGLKKLLATIREHFALNLLPDLYITNFIYYHAADDTFTVSKYDNKMKEGFIDWNKVKSFHFQHVIIMHALTYRTEKLRATGIVLPEHTFYVDNIYTFVPLPKLINAYYLNVNLYKYFIGRADQSVNIVNCIERYKQQIRVMTIMYTAYTLKELKALPKGLKKYMLHYLHTITMVTLMFSCGKNTKARRADVKEMWRTLKKHDKKLYRKIKYSGYPLTVAFLPYCMRPRIMRLAYDII
ncbi:MAG: glycosyltransferase family 2 protein, partial [Clostridia bacterium]|nr:glycosyltransferase family 2 protein [Clostridia bacterium]